MRFILRLVLSIYLLIGLGFGLLMKTAIPPINGAGVIYIAVTWPLQLKISPIEPPIPSWAFTFEDHS